MNTDKEQYEGGWKYEPEFLRLLAEKVNGIENGDGLGMEEVEAVLIAVNYPSTPPLEEKTDSGVSKEEMTETIAGILYANKSDEGDEGSWINSEHFYEVAGKIASQFKAEKTDAVVKNIQHHLDMWSDEPKRVIRLVQKEIDAYNQLFKSQPIKEDK